MPTRRREHMAQPARHSLVAKHFLAARRLSTAALTILAAACLLVPSLGALTASPAVATGAAATTSNVMLALDPSGPWNSNLDTSPFGDTSTSTPAPTLWVPGDEATGVIYIQTTTCQTATGTATVSLTSGSSALANSLQVSESLNGYGPVPSGSTFTIQGGIVNKLELDVIFPYGIAPLGPGSTPTPGVTPTNPSDNSTQNQAVTGLTLTVTLTCPDSGSITTASGTTTQVPAGNDLTANPSSTSSTLAPQGAAGASATAADTPWVTTNGTGSVTQAPPIISLSATATVAAGCTLSYSGDNFGLGDSITVTSPDGQRQNPTVQASTTASASPASTGAISGFGSISGSFTIASSLAPGTYNLTVADLTSGTTSTAPVTVTANTGTCSTAPSDMTQAPTLTVTSQAAAGSSLTVTGAGYSPGSRVTIVGPDGVTTSVVVASDGTIRAVLPVSPALTPGSYNVTASQAANPTTGAGAVSTSALFTVTGTATSTSPSLSISASVPPGASAQISGTGFTPNTTVTVTPAWGGSPITMTVGANGSFTGSLPVPAGQAAGNYPVTVTSADGSTSTTYLTVSSTAPASLTPSPAATITVPASVPAGGALAVTGNNLPPGAIVTLTPPGGGSPLTMIVGPGGTLTGAMPIPANTPPGNYTLTVTLPGGITLTTHYTVTSAPSAPSPSPSPSVSPSPSPTATATPAPTPAPSTTASPSPTPSSRPTGGTGTTTPAGIPSLSVSGSVKPGDSAQVTGSGFAPGTTVTLSLPGGGTMSVTVGPDGSFTVSIPIPASLPSGVYPLVVTNADGSTTTSYITVSSTAPESLAPVPTPTVTVPSSVNAGGSLPLVGDNLPAGSTLTVTGPDGSTYTLTVGTDGSVYGVIPIPADTPPGLYTMTITLPGGQVLTVSYRVTPADASGGGSGSGLVGGPPAWQGAGSAGSGQPYTPPGVGDETIELSWAYVIQWPSRLMRQYPLPFGIVLGLAAFSVYYLVVTHKRRRQAEPGQGVDGNAGT